jgi:acyl phosphate:glycerol-3-phosphate acyltransferase
VDWARRGLRVGQNCGVAVLAPAAIAVAAFFAGAIPFSNIAARRRAGVDLREVGTGTVSGTSLFRVTGFGALAVAGILDVGKGAVGPLLATGHPALAAVCAGLAVTGHNWSPFLRGAGGRGIAPALGGLFVVAWPGAVVLLAGLVLGRFARQTGFGSFVSEAALVPVTALTHGPTGALAGICVATPMMVKRILGNAPPQRPDGRVYLRRLLFDRDERDEPDTRRAEPA